MNTRESSENQQANVRLGYTMRLATVVAIGSLVTVGLSIYLFLGRIFEISGAETPATYALTLFFFLPMALALAERASVTPGRGGIFNLSRSSGSVPLAFAAGWLLLGGLLSLAAIFAWEGGLVLSELLSLFSETQLEAHWFAASLILIVLLFARWRASEIWRRRSTLVYAAIILLLIIIFAAWFAPIEIPTTWVYLPSSNLLQAAPLVVISLWSVQFVLERRDAVRRPRRQMMFALYAPVAIGGLLGAVAAVTLILFPSLTFLETLPLFTLAQQMHPILALSVLVVMLLISLVGINESLKSLLSTSQAMAVDGFLPEQLQLRQRILLRPTYIRLGFVLVSPLLVLLLPFKLTILQASGTVLVALILVYVQDLFRSKPNLAANRWPRLPFHPLFPGISAAFCVTLLITQGIDTIFGLGGWIAAGILVYIFVARSGAIQVRQRDAMVAGATLAAKKTGYRVLVAVSDPSKAAVMLRLGAQIAAARGGLMVVLRVAKQTGDEQTDQEQAVSAWQYLNDIIAGEEGIPVSTTPLVRLAPDAASGILTTIWEEKIDLALLGWPGGHAADMDERDGAIGQIVHKAQCEVVVLNGSWPQRIERVLVPVLSAGHSVAALSLGQDLLTEPDNAGQVVALRVIRGKLTPENRQQASTQLRKTENKLERQDQIRSEVVGSANTKEEILETAEAYDVMLLGLSDEGFLAETDFSGLPVDIALNTARPTLLVKRPEKYARYWLRRSWDQLSSILPKLSPKRRAVVGVDMRQDARADIDFYVLMVLAASIALFGLLQNSAAVIIGAMLVAPLMSPILAMSHSIVRGQLTILKQAIESTANGVILAITVGALLSLLLASLGIPIPPTTEILARTHPNILDLLVALASGAAAAYAISRSEVSAALPGVAIAAALVPPLAVTGYGLGTAQFDIASGSLLLFLANLAAIIISAAVVFLLLGFRPPMRDDRDEQARHGLRMAVIALVLIAIPLFATTRASAAQATRDKTVNTILDQYWPPNQAEAEDVVIVDKWSHDLLVSFTVYDYTGVVTDQSLAGLQSRLSSALDEPVVLEARTINARLKQFDDTSAARVLTQTPTPTAEATGELLPVLTATPITEVTESATSLPTVTLIPSPLATSTTSSEFTETPAAVETAVPTAVSTPES